MYIHKASTTRNIIQIHISILSNFLNDKSWSRPKDSENAVTCVRRFPKTATRRDYINHPSFPNAYADTFLSIALPWVTLSNVLSALTPSKIPCLYPVVSIVILGLLSFGSCRWHLKSDYSSFSPNKGISTVRNALRSTITPQTRS